MEEGSRALFSGPRPRNVRTCLSVNENKRGQGIRYSYGPGGSQKLDPIPAWQGKARMKTDIDAQIR